MTSKGQIREWLDKGVAQGASHMIVVCDTWDWDDFPSYVAAGESVRDKVAGVIGTGGMMKVMEVYNLALPLEPQLNEYRAFHY